MNKELYEGKEPVAITVEMAEEFLDAISDGKYVINVKNRLCGAFYKEGMLYEAEFYGHVAAISYKEGEPLPKDDMVEVLRFNTAKAFVKILKERLNMHPIAQSVTPTEIVIEFFDK